MKKSLVTLFAILGALAAAAALVYLFRDKIADKIEELKAKFSCKCDEEDELVEPEEFREAVEEKAEDLAEAVEEKAEDLADAVEDVAEDVVDEIKDFADVD